MGKQGTPPRSAARICRWHDGKQAALSLRFDDSHSTHIQNALPLLNEYGCIGTFLVNPGNPGYQQQRTAWEGALLQGGHEMGDHTLNHSGARTDREAEMQIGEAAAAIRRADPEHSQLLVFAAGGATAWLQRKPFDFFLAKYDLFRVGGSLSCNEEAGFTVDTLARRLDQAIANGDWMQAHFHCVGPGHLPISVETFRKVLGEVRGHRDEVWQAGMSTIHQYEQERDHSIVWARPLGDDEVGLDLVCEVAPDLFRQPLSLELDLPARVTRVSVTDATGKAVPSRVVRAADGRVVRFETAPQDATFVVKAKGLGTAYRRRYGSDLAVGPHPYLFFGSADLPALRAKMTQPVAAGIWERLKARADELCQGDPSSWQASAGDSSWRARALAFAYAMTGERKYADRAWVEVEALLSSDAWHRPTAEALRTAEAAGTLAMAYDWMHDALTDEQRRRMREAMIEYGILPIMKDVEDEEWYTVWSRCNWGGVIFGQIGIAALSLLDDDPRAADWARVCRQKIWHYTQSLGRDGGWGESATYAQYIWFRFLLLADALRRCSRGQTDCYDTPGLPHLPEWFEQLLEPDGAGYIPFSNCGRWADSGSILLRLASQYRDGHAQWFATRMVDRTHTSDPFAFLWVDPDLAPTPPTDLPRAKVFRHIDWAFARSKWDDPNAVLFALKGGQMDWDHQHHDANSFVLYGYGRPLIVDLLYPHDIWGCQTEAHNTIMVNGREQAGVVRVAGNRGHPRRRTVISDLLESPWYVRMVGDASLAYEPADVDSFVREVMYLRQADPADPLDYFVLFDDVDVTAPMRMDWLLHTYGQVTREAHRTTITQDQAAVDVTLVSPQGTVCEVGERSLDDIRVPSPLEGVTVLRQLRFTPAAPTARGFFVSVLAPRPASASPKAVAVTAIEGDNLRGAEVADGGVRDLALFALEAPEIKAAGVEAVGRSCFVRQAQGKVSKAALHGGQHLTVNGVRLFETEHSGSAAFSFSEQGVEGTMRLFDAHRVSFHADRRPSKVIVDGREREFQYDPQTQLVVVKAYGPREVRAEY